MDRNSRLWISMTWSLKYVTYFPMYYRHMTLPSAETTLTPAEFLFHFIGKAQFRRAMLSCITGHIEHLENSCCHIVNEQMAGHLCSLGTCPVFAIFICFYYCYFFTHFCLCVFVGCAFYSRWSRWTFSSDWQYVIWNPLSFHFMCFILQ